MIQQHHIYRLKVLNQFLMAYIKSRFLLSTLDFMYYIIDAARRFFLSKSEEFAQKEKGIYDTKVQKQRRRNRIMKVLFFHIMVCIHVWQNRSWNQERQL